MLRDIYITILIIWLEEIFIWKKKKKKINTILYLNDLFTVDQDCQNFFHVKHAWFSFFVGLSSIPYIF